MSFKHEKKRNYTELSKHVWQLKDQKKDFTISWKVLTKAKASQNDATFVTPRNFTFYVGHTWQRSTNAMNLYQLAGISENFYLNSNASLRTNHSFQYVSPYCYFHSNFVTASVNIILLMYINPNDAIRK